MKIYIAHDDFGNFSQKNLFILSRPFYSNNIWSNKPLNFKKWNISDQFQYCENIEEADLLLVAKPINEYFKENKIKSLKKINSICVKNNIDGFGYISGDFGQAFPEFSNLTYYRMGGFKGQLSKKNIGFPVWLSDHYQTIYLLDHPIPRPKTKKPVIGFCGHATGSSIKKGKEVVKCLLENIKRLFQKPFRRDWEPLFASAYERWRLLQLLEQSQELHTKFIYRKHYRGGALTEGERHETTLEYYDNLLQSDYVLCVRGAGNFSVRFYETLMMGKIPIFVNTDCLLPLADEIDWKKHVVWVEWDERHLIASKVVDFHKNISSEAFMELQLQNRKLWKEQLTVGHYLQKLSNDL